MTLEAHAVSPATREKALLVRTVLEPIPQNVNANEGSAVKLFAETSRGTEDVELNHVGRVVRQTFR